VPLESRTALVEAVATRVMKRLAELRAIEPPLDNVPEMIGLDPVVPVSSAAMTTAISDLALGFQFADCGRITPVSVNRHHEWWPVIRICERGFAKRHEIEMRTA
jgi:hypothetical protein